MPATSVQDQVLLRALIADKSRLVTFPGFVKSAPRIEICVVSATERPNLANTKSTSSRMTRGCMVHLIAGSETVVFPELLSLLS